MKNMEIFSTRVSTQMKISADLAQQDKQSNNSKTYILPL